MIFFIVLATFLIILGTWFYIQRVIANLQKQMRESFQSISFEIMERTNRSFLELAQSTLSKTEEGVRLDIEAKQKALEAMMSPLRDTMKSLSEQQRDIENKRESAYVSLFKQIECLTKTEADLRKETAQLSMALRSPSIRGAWGQLHLRRVVELAGLLNRCDFTEQTSHENDGKTLRPDLIIHLPHNRHVIVDAKTPLSAYLEAFDGPYDEKQRHLMLQQHVVQLRRHMRELSQKDYWKRFDLSVEFVILFLPSESIFGAALEVDPSLIELGAEQSIIIATPTTLIAILRAIAHSWKQEAISKNAEEIAILGQELYDRLTLLTEYWSKVGRSLTTAVDSYNQAVASFESRVLVPARKLKDHGIISVNKDLVPIESIDRMVRLNLNSDYSKGTKD